MEPTTEQELSFEEGVAEVMRSLPPPIRSYLKKQMYLSVISGITQKYQLHADQAGILEREVLFLLMGVRNPTEFAAALASDAQIPPATISAIMSDVNEQVFAPLQRQMQEAPHAARAPAVARTPITPVIAQPQRVAPAPPANLPGTPLADALAKAGVSVVAPKPAPAAGAGAGSMNLLSDHEEPHIDIKAASQAPAPAAQPMQVFRTRKPSDGDPYREPIDEK